MDLPIDVYFYTDFLVRRKYLIFVDRKTRSNENGKQQKSYENYSPAHIVPSVFVISDIMMLVYYSL